MGYVQISQRVLKVKGRKRRPAMVCVPGPRMREADLGVIGDWPVVDRPGDGGAEELFPVDAGARC